MRKQLSDTYTVTLALQQLLDQEITPKNREEVIEQLNELIAARGTSMDQLHPPYSEEEKALGAKIYELNVEIEGKMQELFSDLKKEMKQVQKQKKSNQSYTNPYKNVQVSDGTFLDSKN